MSVKIIIGDGQARVRHGLRILLEQQPGWSLAGEAADAQELLTLLDSDAPDLVLLDWQLPGLPPRELLKILRLGYPHLCVICLSGRSELRQAALAAGATAFVSKTEPPEKLIALIQELHANGTLWIGSPLR